MMKLKDMKVHDILKSERYRKGVKNEWNNRASYPPKYREVMKRVFGTEIADKMANEYILIIDRKSKLSKMERAIVSVYCLQAYNKLVRQMMEEEKKEES